MTFTPEQKKALEAKLDASVVKPPPKGKYGSYIEGWHAIAEANRIFGHDGWSYRVDRLEKTGETGYMALVTVEAGGVSRQDIGHGQGHQKNQGDATESAIKEAVTDGLKRALRTFGNPFGLALYDKSGENVERSNGATRPPPPKQEPSDVPVSQLLELVNMAQTYQALKVTREMPGFQHDAKRLSKSDQEVLRKAIAAKEATFTQATHGGK